MADRLGFEPKTALQLYGISSAAPSTGLGHLSVKESLGEDQHVTVVAQVVIAACRPRGGPAYFGIAITGLLL
jgi:hypothetical protein